MKISRVIAVALLATGCAGAGSARPASNTANRDPVTAPWSSMCGMVVAGADVSLEDTTEGIGVLFTTAETKAHDAHVRVSGLGMALANRTDAELPPVHAIAHSMDSGAHLMLTADDPGRADDLRAVVRARIASLTAHGCPPPAATPEPELPPAFRKPTKTYPSAGGHVH